MSPSEPSRPPPAPLTARRHVLAALIPLVVALGLAIRFGVPGIAGDLAGGALYTVLVALLIGLVFPRLASLLLASTALAVSWSVEFFQLTPFPAASAQAFPPVALVLGRSFVWTDLAAYLLGAALFLTVDRTIGHFLARRGS